jgi:hypothetical protein
MDCKIITIEGKKKVLVVGCLESLTVVDVLKFNRNKVEWPTILKLIVINKNAINS